MTWMNDLGLSNIDLSELLARKSRVLCAVSGGADSMALLHLINSRKKELDLDSVSAFHLNHNLRGIESDEDEYCVRSFCEANGIPFYGYKLTEEEIHDKSEDNLRKLRYKYLEITAEEIKADYIATGHTASDQLETILLNLGRGSGLKGLGGIPQKRGKIVRPLLYVTKDETIEYCTNNNIQYREDSSNYSDDYLRNRVRHHIVPEYKSIFSDLEHKVSNSCNILLKADRYLSLQAEKLLDACKLSASSINTLQLQKLDPILLEYLYMCFLNRNSIPFDHNDINGLVVLTNNQGKLQLKKGFLAEHHSNILRLMLPDVNTFISYPLNFGLNDFGNHKSVSVQKKDLRLFNNLDNKKSLYNWIDCDKVIGTLVIRNWVFGDVFSSARRSNTKSLKKIFQEKRLSLEDKHQQVVISDANGIVWLEGEGASKYAVADENTNHYLEIEVIRRELYDR